MVRWFTAHWVDALIIVLLVTVVFAVRLPIMAERKIMPAGDAFNHHYIASHMLRLDYPKQEKRLPVYSIPLALGRVLGFDPIHTSLAVSLAASAGIMAALYLVGRELDLARASLVAFLGLGIFDPLLTVNGIRPLSDSLFVFWVLLAILAVTRLIQQTAKPRPQQLLVAGAVVALMMFTRYEGFLIAALLLPCLWLRRTWKEVLVVAIIPVTITILWIPIYLYVHGSWGGLSYITDATSPRGGFGEVALIPENVERMLNGAGWLRTWSIPEAELNESPHEEAGIRTLTSPAWWLSVLSVLGVFWIVIRSGRASAPLLLAAAGYTLLLAWWWVYSRYVAPLSAIFYLTAAAGASIFFTLLHRYGLKRQNHGIYITGMFLVAAGMGYIVWHEAPAMYATALGRAWEGNRKGYALYEAIQFVGKQSEPVSLAADYPMAVYVLGSHGQPKTAINPGLGVYLVSKREASVNELYQEWQTKKVGYVIETSDDPRLPDMIQRLKADGRIVETRIFRHTHWDDSETETIPVHRLRWD